MYKIIPAALIMIMTFSACNEAEEEQTDVISTTPPPVAAPALPTDSMQTVLPMTTPPPPVAAPVGKLNPPHGEPGHRCDIEVGQPLSSAAGPAPGAATIKQTPPVMQNPQPVMQNPQPVMQNPQPVMATPPPANLLPNTAKGAVNPAHGQPGHRCDIAVGAPLN